MVRRHPSLETLEPFAVAQHLQVLVPEWLDPAFHDLAYRRPFLPVRQADAVAHDLAHGVVARGAAEDEDDGRQHLALTQFVDDLGAPRGAKGQTRTPAPDLPVGRAALERPAHGLVDAQPLLTGPAVVLEQRLQEDLLVLPADDREVVAEHDGPVPFDDHRRVTAHRPQPSAEFVRVVHRGREAHEADLGRREDEHFLPDPAPVGVLNEVHLVEDHRVEPLEEVGPGQEHVAKDLGGHHDHGRPRAHGGVARQQADVVLAVGRHELPVLLVGQGLEGRRVEGLAACAQRTVNGVGRDERLARSRRSGHEDGMPGIERTERLVLEVIEGEGQGGLERLRPGRLLDGPRGRRQRPSSFPMPIDRK